VLGSRIANHLADRFPGQRPAGLPPIDVMDFYRFIGREEFGDPITSASAPDSNTLNWFVPPIGRGSGGHHNIFRFIRNLEELGYVNRIIVCDQANPYTTAELKRNINEWFFPLRAEVFVQTGSDPLPAAHISIATGWQTAYPVRNFRSTARKAYFVQDFEPYFYSLGSEYAFAENTYNFGFAGITAGNWLEEKLGREYGMKCRAFGFSYDREIHKPQPREEGGSQNIFVYARPVTARRGFELTVLALGEVVSKMPDTTVIFAGWDVSNYRIRFRHANMGTVDPGALPDLYGQCDAALVVSMTNLSLLPLELMACGCPVVSNNGPHVEWLLNDQNSELADPTVEALAGGLRRVLFDKERRRTLIRNGFETSAATDWKKEAAKVATFLNELAA
jgi:glycosyltransferase involved in cell wall biosynthesis